MTITGIIYFLSSSLQTKTVSCFLFLVFNFIEVQHFQVSCSFQHYQVWSLVVVNVDNMGLDHQGSFVVQAISHLKFPRKKKKRTTNCITLKEEDKSHWLIIHWNKNNPGKTFDSHFLHSVSNTIQRLLCFRFHYLCFRITCEINRFNKNKTKKVASENHV